MHRRPTTRVRRTLLGAVAAFALIATSCAGSADTAVESSAAPAVDAATEATEAEVTEAAPAEASIIAPTVTGGQIDFASLQGQDVVLWFWAPW